MVDKQEQFIPASFSVFGDIRCCFVFGSYSLIIGKNQMNDIDVLA